MRNELEQLVADAGKAWEGGSLARIWKIPEALTQTPCDFFGYRRDGKAILIECKIRNKKSLSIGSKGDVPAHQYTALAGAEACGSVALLVWQNKDKIMVIKPWQLNEFLKDRESLSWEAPLAKYPIGKMRGDALNWLTQKMMSD